MDFHMKRPLYRAEQFDGTTQAAEAIQFLAGASGFTITQEGADATMRFSARETAMRASETSFTVKRGDYVVRCPNGDVQVMGLIEFSRDFEPTQRERQAQQFSGAVTYSRGIETRNNIGIE